MQAYQDIPGTLDQVARGEKLDINLDTTLEDIFMVLTQREKDIIVQRFGLDDKPRRTLESIGDAFAITRERVRQIENIALGKLTRVLPNTGLRIINEMARRFIAEAGGIMLEETVVAKVLNAIAKTTPVDGYIVRLALNIDNALVKQEKSNEFKAFWYQANLPFDTIKGILTVAYRYLKPLSDVVPTEKAVNDIAREAATRHAQVTPEMVNSTLYVDRRFKSTEKGWGLMEWRHINPKSIRDKAYIILKEAKEPLHFVDIANRIIEHGFDRKVATVQAVHNELIRYERFVLVGRGLYALSEWGYEPGTVCDVIEDILKNAGRPMRKQEIINEVLKRRTVKIGTISLNLQNFAQFVRIGRALYTYDEKKKKKAKVAKK